MDGTTMAAAVAARRPPAPQPPRYAIRIKQPVDSFKQRHVVCAFCKIKFLAGDKWAGQWKDDLIHMACLEEYRIAFQNRPKSGVALPDLSCLSGPPTVRVVRLSLVTRPRAPAHAAPEGPSPPRPPRPPRHPLSPLRPRTRSRRSRRNKNATQPGGEREEDDNKLPMSITLGRALGAQVQPLMAILMSPRVRTLSTHSEESGDEASEDECGKPKTPLLSITSLELPDLAPVPSPQCRPARRVRTSVRRQRPVASDQHQPATAQPVCAALPLNARKCTQLH